ncbi:MAG: hypothetical protein K0R00_3174 [Herbinix sp.]|nr:hypothetical protein [Herbinix sp.]
MSEDSLTVIETTTIETSDPIVTTKIVYTVQEIKEILNIGINQAYELVNSNQFPVKHIGKKKVVPAKPFMQWLNS